MAAEYELSVQVRLQLPRKVHGQIEKIMNTTVCSVKVLHIDIFVCLIFMVQANHKNILTMKISPSTVLHKGQIQVHACAFVGVCVCVCHKG